MFFQLPQPWLWGPPRPPADATGQHADSGRCNRPWQEPESKWDPGGTVENQISSLFVIFFCQQDADTTIMHSEYKAKLNQIRNIYNEELEKWVKEWNLDRTHCDVQVRCRLPRVHDSRDELAERAVADEADHPEGDWEDGPDYSQKVQLYTGTTYVPWTKLPKLCWSFSKGRNLRGAFDFNPSELLTCHPYVETDLCELSSAWLDFSKACFYRTKVFLFVGFRKRFSISLQKPF